MPRRKQPLTRLASWRVLVPLLVVLAVVFLGYRHYHKTPAKQPVVTPVYTKTQSGADVNLSPATDAEKKDSESTKVAPQTSPTPTSTDNAKQAVNIVVTSTDPSAIRAYIPNIIEDGGICTATYTNGSVTKTGTSSGISNVSTTVCPPIMLSGINSGVWTLKYSYQSDKYSGSISKSVQL